eukprot:6207620-Pleurochrysis_carterae.AAC.3
MPAGSSLDRASSAHHPLFAESVQSILTAKIAGGLSSTRLLISVSSASAGVTPYALEKQKQAAAGLTFKINPTPLFLLKQLHKYLCDLQPANAGRRLTVLKQLAGQRGGDLQHWHFDVISGDLVARLFKSTFVFGTQQGSGHIRDDGTILAVTAPLPFAFEQKQPAHLNDPVPTVTIDTLTLLVDGVWRFDEKSFDCSTSSKEHMKRYLSRQLRVILYERMQQGGSSSAAQPICLLNARQQVQ